MPPRAATLPEGHPHHRHPVRRLKGAKAACRPAISPGRPCAGDERRRGGIGGQEPRFSADRAMAALRQWRHLQLRPDPAIVVTSLAARLSSTLRRAVRPLGLGTSGCWGLAPGAQGMVAALVEPGADGAPRLAALRFLSAEGAQPARRAVDVAAAIAKPAACCVFLLPGEDYRVVFLPGLPVAAAERNDALRWRLKDEIDFPPDEAIVDCVSAPVNSPSMENGLWMAVAARSARVGEFVGPLVRAGVQIAAVDVPELAQRNLAMRLAQPGRTVAMLTMDAHRGLLTVTRDDGVLAARHFDPLAAALAAADADRRTALLDRLALELQRTFDNVERQYNAGPIERVVVSCEPAADDLMRALREALGAPVEALELQRVCGAEDASLMLQAAASRAACLAIGAALRGCDGEGE
jgi:MSHA biogenesis protein MshI